MLSKHSIIFNELLDIFSRIVYNLNMKINIKIEDLIENQIIESQRVEYKKGFNPDSIIKTICAFANDIDNIGGGYIVIGVEQENGVVKQPVKGLDISEIDSIQKKLFDYCHAIEPSYRPIIEEVQYQNKYLIVVYAYGGYNRPYAAPKEVTSKSKEKFRFIRKNVCTIIPNQEEERELIEISKKIPFDDSPCFQSNIVDLDIGLMREYLKEVNSKLYFDSNNLSVEKMASNLNLISDNGIKKIPLNVGILMFSENPQKYFKRAVIEIVIKPSLDGQNMIEKKFDGPIQRQLTNALQYIKGFVIEQKNIKVNMQAESKVYYNYPYPAIEELLSNAVYHKSYEIDCPITVMIYNDKIEITSYPGFDKSISIEDINNHNISSKIYRNRRIGDFLKELKLIEGRNTGFPRIYDSLNNNESDDLQIDMDYDRRYVSITVNINKLFGENNETKLSNYEQQILDALKKSPLNLTELSKSINNNYISKKLSKTIKDLCDRRIIFKTFDNKYSLSEISVTSGKVISSIKTDKNILNEGLEILKLVPSNDAIGLEKQLKQIQEMFDKINEVSFDQQIKDLDEVYIKTGIINQLPNNVIKMNYDYAVLLQKLNIKEKIILDKLVSKYKNK